MDLRLNDVDCAFVMGIDTPRQNLAALRSLPKQRTGVLAFVPRDPS